MQPEQRYIIIIGFFSTLLSWLCYASFAYISLIINQHYFPSDSQPVVFIHNVLSFCNFYISCSIGALLFGQLSDKQYAPKALSMSLFLMGITTLILSCLPSYESFDISATVFLTLLRFLQGVALGGEMNNMSIFLFQTLPKRYANFVCCFVPIACGLGLMAGCYISHIWQSSWFSTGAWRLLFLGLSLGCLALSYLRFTLPTFTATLTATHNKKNWALITICMYYKKYLLFSLLISIFITIYLSTATVSFLHFLVHHLHYSQWLANLLIMTNTLFTILMIPMIAYIANSINSKSLILLGLLGSALIWPLIYELADIHSIFILCLLELFSALFSASAIAPLLSWQISKIPREVRYTVTSFSFSVSLALMVFTIHTMENFIIPLTHWHLIPALISSAFTILLLLIIMLIPQQKTIANERKPSTTHPSVRLPSGH